MELSNVYRSMMGQEFTDVKSDYINIIRARFRPISDFAATYVFLMDDDSDPLVVSVNGDDIDASYRPYSGGDVILKITDRDMNEITGGRMTFTRAFNSGSMSAKGDFNTLYKLDELFVF
jgi:hypothetical protein